MTEQTREHWPFIPPQLATVVIEHVSAISDFDDGVADDSCFVAACLVHDNGKRERVT